MDCFEQGGPFTAVWRLAMLGFHDLYDVKRVFPANHNRWGVGCCIFVACSDSTAQESFLLSDEVLWCQDRLPACLICSSAFRSGDCVLCTAAPQGAGVHLNQLAGQMVYLEGRVSPAPGQCFCSLCALKIVPGEKQELPV